jgi:hypothetical protein
MKSEPETKDEREEKQRAQQTRKQMKPQSVGPTQIRRRDEGVWECQPQNELNRAHKNQMKSEPETKDEREEKKKKSMREKKGEHDESQTRQFFLYTRAGPSNRTTDSCQRGEIST